jgi:hypothetical protein
MAEPRATGFVTASAQRKISVLILIAPGPGNFANGDSVKKQQHVFLDPTGAYFHRCEA